RARGGVRLEVRARAIALDRVAPLRNLPFELDLRQGGRLGQIDLDALASGLDVADVDEARERRGPEPRDRTAARVEREVVARTFVVPARRHHPAVVLLEILLLWPRRRRLVPGMALTQAIAWPLPADER